MFQEFVKSLEHGHSDNSQKLPRLVSEYGRIYYSIIYEDTLNCNLMLAYLREHNTAQSVIDIFNQLEENLVMFNILCKIVS